MYIHKRQKGFMAENAAAGIVGVREESVSALLCMALYLQSASWCEGFGPNNRKQTPQGWHHELDLHLPKTTTIGKSATGALSSSKMKTLLVMQGDLGSGLHNNTRPDVARACGQFLEDEGTDTTNWPSHSPDLNPMEILGDIMSDCPKAQ